MGKMSMELPQEKLIPFFVAPSLIFTAILTLLFLILDHFVAFERCSVRHAVYDILLLPLVFLALGGFLLDLMVNLKSYSMRRLLKIIIGIPSLFIISLVTLEHGILLANYLLTFQPEKKTIQVKLIPPESVRVSYFGFDDYAFVESLKEKEVLCFSDEKIRKIMISKRDRKGLFLMVKKGFFNFYYQKVN